MFCLREHGALGESMPDRKFKQEKKSVNIWLLAKSEEHRRTVIFYWKLFQFVNHVSGGLILVLMFMCVLIFLCFFLIRPTWHGRCWWETDRIHVFLVLVRLIWSLFRENGAIEARATCPIYQKNLVSGSLLCRDGFKMMLEWNKCIFS
jgi:hypothetical protein